MNKINGMRVDERESTWQNIRSNEISFENL